MNLIRDVDLQLTSFEPHHGGVPRPRNSYRKPTPSEGGRQIESNDRAPTDATNKS